MEIEEKEIPLTPEVMDDEIPEPDPAPNPTAALARDEDAHLDDVAHEKRVYKKLHGRKGILDLVSNIPKLKNLILRLIKDRPDLLEQDERYFKDQLRKNLTLNLLRLRKSFWMEFESAYSHGRKMNVISIYSGIVQEPTWYKIIEDAEKLAFIICPPVDYLIMLKESHDAGLNAIREILSAKVLDEDGYLIPKAAEAVIKAYALIDLRLKGAVVQRIDQRTINYNQNVNQQLPAGAPAPFTMDEINKQLAETQRQLARYENTTTTELLEMKKDITIPIVHKSAKEDIETGAVVYEQRSIP